MKSPETSLSSQRKSSPRKERVQILVCYHKPGEILKSRYICPIHVGREASRAPLPNIIGDNTGDNISARNKNFCELTALYWAWRNVNAEYYGLMHYRRVFDFSDQYQSPNCYSLDESVQKQLGLDDETIMSSLGSCDVILPKIVDVPRSLASETVREQYCHEHLEEDLHLLRTAIQTKAPHTLEDFDEVFSGKEAYFYSMFVMREELFHDYAPWLFSILFELDSLIDLKNRDEYQKRVYGFLGERLLSVFIHHCRRVQNIRVKELPVVFVADKRPGLVHAFQTARRRFVRLKLRKKSIYLKLLGREFRYGNEGL